MRMTGNNLISAKMKWLSYFLSVAWMSGDARSKVSMFRDQLIKAVLKSWDIPAVITTPAAIVGWCIIRGLSSSSYGAWETLRNFLLRRVGMRKVDDGTIMGESWKKWTLRKLGYEVVPDILYRQEEDKRKLLLGALEESQAVTVRIEQLPVEEEEEPRARVLAEITSFDLNAWELYPELENVLFIETGYDGFTVSTLTSLILSVRQGKPAVCTSSTEMALVGRLSARLNRMVAVRSRQEAGRVAGGAVHDQGGDDVHLRTTIVGTGGQRLVYRHHFVNAQFGNDGDIVLGVGHSVLDLFTRVLAPTEEEIVRDLHMVRSRERVAVMFK
jgi:hypothetical protein